MLWATHTHSYLLWFRHRIISILQYGHANPNSNPDTNQNPKPKLLTGNSNSPNTTKTLYQPSLLL